MKTERRRFLAAGTVAAISIWLPLSGPLRAARFLQGNTPLPTRGEINDWVWIQDDGRILLGVSQAEVGQGIYTGLAEVLADEMDADWEQVSVQFVTGREAYRQVAGGEAKSQFVAASTSMTVFYPRLRQAGAQARDLLRRAGALYFGVAPDQCRTEKSHVIDILDGRRIGYGELLSLASRLKPDPDAPLKTLDESRKGLIGARIHRIDTRAKVEGSAIFGIDVQVPDMLIGVPWMVPGFTGRVLGIRNAATIRALPGIVDLVPSRHLSINNMVGRDPDHSPNTIIVVAHSYWQARKAADLLDVDYDPGPGADLDSAGIDAANAAMLASDKLVTATDRSDARSLIEQAAIQTDPHLHEARYSAPYSNQATMEPCNATSFHRGDHIETWGPFQGQDVIRGALGKMFKLAPDKVIVNTTFVGGSFGRKYIPDAVIHATAASRAVGRPVKVIYPRDIDIQHGYFRPGEIGHFRALLNADGYPKALWARYAGQSLFWQMHRDFVEKAGGWDETMVECVYDTIYAIPGLRVESGIVDQVIPVSYMRGVGSVASLFFYESFVSELADQAGIDGHTYRRRLLAAEPEALAVLDAAATAADWHQPLPPGHYRGLAFNEWEGRNHAFTSHVALVIEIRLVQDKVSIVKATCAVDCGRVINPNLVKAMMEGGIGFGLTIAFKSQLHFKHGATVEENFNTYPLAGIQAMPEVEVVLIDSPREPQGVGEIATAVVAPALADALHQATGRYYRELPFPPEVQPDRI